jgi:tRNA threonylcarbamoyladenosine biosynthesis protein TsaE
MMPEQRLAFDLADEAATADLAAGLAGLARPGDVFALSGELGSGKSVFARAFIAARGGTEDVPSPTFTLVQIYELAGGAIYHFDLFRLDAPEDAYELGIEDAFADAISLIEWPERLGSLLPGERLDVAFAFGERESERHVDLSCHADWPERLQHLDFAA